MRPLENRTQRQTTSLDVLKALDDVFAAEKLVGATKRAIGRLVRDAYRERGLPTDTIVEKSLLAKMMRGDTFSEPAIQRVITDLSEREQQ